MATFYQPASCGHTFSQPPKPLAISPSSFVFTNASSIYLQSRLSLSSLHVQRDISSVVVKSSKNIKENMKYSNNYEMSQEIVNEIQSKLDECKELVEAVGRDKLWGISHRLSLCGLLSMSGLLGAQVRMLRNLLTSVDSVSHEAESIIKRTHHIATSNYGLVLTIGFFIQIIGIPVDQNYLNILLSALFYIAGLIARGENRKEIFSMDISIIQLGLLVLMRRPPRVSPLELCLFALRRVLMSILAFCLTFRKTDSLTYSLLSTAMSLSLN